MTKYESLKVINKTYPGQLKITDNKRISNLQAAKKIYHDFYNLSIEILSETFH